MSGLEFDGVQFAVDGHVILRDVSGRVEPRETLALLGPSGCGKTTLLRVIAGLERPTGGTVSFDGVDVTTLPAHQRGFGMMFQDHALFPHLDVAGNIEFGLKRSGWASEQRAARVHELLGMVDLAGFGPRRIDNLSGGERQRVALARALAPKPKLLMLDEPLASLDRGLRERLVLELRGILHDLGLPAIYVTHDQAEAFAISDRVAIMRAGEIVRVGPAPGLWGEPRTAFVARFLGMENIIAGTRDRDGWVRTGFGRFGPLGGPAGEVTLLLRAEGARLVPGTGANVAEGIVATSLFRGDSLAVTLAAGLERVEFAIPNGEAPPEVGSVGRFSVARAQELSDE